jgi:hypothetical protein
MIYFVRSATIRQGQSREARQWVHWMVSCESMALFGEIWDRMRADPGYQEVISGAEELIVQESLIDNFYRKVE